jgi:hypothetical protein
VSAQDELDAAIRYIKQRKIPIGRIMAVVNATRKLDAEIIRSMEDGVIHANGQRYTSLDLVAEGVEAQIEESLRDRQFLNHSA